MKFTLRRTQIVERMRACPKGGAGGIHLFRKLRGVLADQESFGSSVCDVFDLNRGKGVWFNSLHDQRATEPAIGFEVLGEIRVVKKTILSSPSRATDPFVRACRYANWAGVRHLRRYKHLLHQSIGRALENAPRRL